MSGFNNPIVGGGGGLVYPSIHSPDFIAGVSGWSINKDGTAEFNQLVLIVQTSAAGILIYNGAAGAGNLIGSWSGSAGTDQFGNPFPAGINVTQGVISGLSATALTVVGSILQNCVSNFEQINQASISGSTITESVITFDTGGGSLVAYATTTTTVIQTVNGQYQLNVPGNVTQGKIECWGAGAGGDGGDSTAGGEGGGGGEYAQEPAYPLVPNSVVNYQVGQGGADAITGQEAESGGDTVFDINNNGVVANGGDAGVNGTGGLGGTGSTNTIHHNGGNGGNQVAGKTGGAGGGGSAGATGAGGNGASPTGATGAAGGTAGTGGGAAGGTGGANAGNGSNGAAPGAGGGGAGAGSSVNQFDKTYTSTDSWSYEGSDGTFANQQINHNGKAYQGGNKSNTFNGKSKTWFVFNGSRIQSDLAGVTLTQVKLTLTCNHTWFNSGMTVAAGSDNDSSFGSTKSDPTAGIDKIEFPISAGQQKTKDVLSSGIGTDFQAGTATNIILFKNSNNLQYYGYFSGGGGASLEFIGTTGTGSTSSGNGTDGQIKITYATAATPLMSIATVAFTDQFGNNIPAGVYFYNTAAPAATPGGFGLYAANGQPAYVNPAGLVMNLSGAQLATFPNKTVTGTALTTVISGTVPANDAEVGAVYELYVAGNGTQGSTAQGVTVAALLGATAIGNQPTSGSGFAAINTIFRWEVRAKLVCISTGAGATWYASILLTLTQNTAAANSQTICASNSVAVAISSIVSNVFAVQLAWNSATGAPTLTANFGYFKRVA